MAWWSRRSKPRGRHALGAPVPSRPDGVPPASPVPSSASASASAPVPPLASAPVSPLPRAQHVELPGPPIAATGAGENLRLAAATPPPARPLGVRLAVDVLPLDPDAVPPAGVTPDVVARWEALPGGQQVETSSVPGAAPADVPLRAVTAPGATHVPADVAGEVALLLATGEAWDQPEPPAPAAPAVAPVALGPASGPVTAAPSAAVPAQVRRHVELGFRDGSSAALDPDGEQARALAELSALLTSQE